MLAPFVAANTLRNQDSYENLVRYSWEKRSK